MRKLGKQGVDEPRVLGMSRGPVVTDQRRAEEQQVLQDARQAMAEAERHMAEARATVDLLREDAAALWQALATVTGFVREVEPFLTQEQPLPDAVQVAMTALIERDYSIPGEPVYRQVAEATERTGPLESACPECVQGKHPNCTHEVLLPDDTMGPCACEAAGHPA